MRENKYNSVKFRIMCEGKGEKASSESGAIRLKKNKLSIALIDSVRAITLKRYTGYKKERLFPDKPTDNEFEVYIISLCSRMLKEYSSSRYKTSVKEDKQLLENKTISERLRFAVIHRLGSKEIIQRNIKYLDVLAHILNKTTTKATFKQTYMARIDSLESEEECFANRRAIREYLRKYYCHMSK